MKQNSGNVRRMLAAAAYGLIILSSVLIIGLSLSQPQYDLPEWQMIVGAVTCALFLIVCFFLWNRLLQKRRAIMEKFSRIGFVVLLAVFSVLLLLVNYTCPNALNNQLDYEEMWKMALAVTNGESLVGYEYLNNYSNNFKPMLLLSVIFRIAAALGINNPYYAVVFVSVLQVAGTVWAVCYLVEDKSEDSFCRFPILFSFILFLPLWANTQAYYTDTSSFGLIVIALALLKKGLCTIGNKRLGWIVLAGCLAAVGISVKITLLIGVIGLLIAVMVTGRMKKYFPDITCFVGTIVAGYLVFECWACTYDAYVLSKEVSDPILSWIAIGLRGKGNYVDNVDFVLNLHALGSKAEKSAYAGEVIRENISNFFNISHYIEKIRYTYADGTFGAGVFAFQYDAEPNLLWNAFSPYGKYFWRTNQICFSYIFGVYIVLLLGQIHTLKNIISGKMPSVWVFFADMSLLGMFLFMAIWEANNRQLYNQIPIVMLGLILHLKLLYGEYARKKKG